MEGNRRGEGQTREVFAVWILENRYENAATHETCYT